MSSLEERNDARIRELLSRFPPPLLTAGFSSEALRRVRGRATEQERQRRAGARLLLGSYWLAAAAASVWILGRLPWPGWLTVIAWGVAVAAAPLAYAVALFPERARAWMAVGLRPLLPPVD